MQRKVAPVFLCIILIPILSLGATSAITATYNQEPYLMFKKGGDGDPYQNTQLVGLLGTMTASFSNPPTTVKEPSLVNSTTSQDFWFEGLFDWNPTNVNTTWELVTTQFYWDTALYINGNLYKVRRQSETGGFAKLTSDSATIPNVTSLVVKIYLRAHHTADKYKPGAEFSLKSGSIGTFNFAVATEGYNINSIQDYVSINGQVVPPLTIPLSPSNPSVPPANSIPIIGAGGSSTTIPAVPYVDEEHPLQVLQYLLSLIEEQEINLPDAYDLGKTEVAKAKIDLIYATPGEKYKVNINFNSLNAQLEDFYLHLDGDPNLYGIPYALDFDGDPAYPGQNILWKDIPASVSSEKTIYVTGISQVVAESAPAGTYHDTITVTITAVT